jgi:methylthioribulose-1-phosphate dehydratase
VNTTQRYDQLATHLAEVGRRFYERQWVLGTSGNFSAVVTTQPLEICITPTGLHKGALSASDFLRLDAQGRSRSTRPGKPSAETPLHVEIIVARTAGSVLHTHSIWSTILSERHRADKGLAIEGYEMLKGLDGVRTHEHREWIPIVENDQDIPKLAARMAAVLRTEPAAHAILISGHGLYTWGRTIADAERHVEILEFLLEIQGRR